MILLWIVVSSLGLWLWLRSGSESPHLRGWYPRVPEARQSRLLYLAILVLGVINLIPATYPLTSAGDEASHAGTFRTMGRGLDALLCPDLDQPFSKQDAHFKADATKG